MLKRAKLNRQEESEPIVVSAYTHKIKIYVQTISFDTQIDFSYEIDYPLLGRDGFFNKFKKITFNGECVELEK
ncbi:MAG TPA: hypothetical protein VMW25_03565 [Clostridia bacterium]|nr:hypothetical protein [Clostridia bacterium]